jgi:hypothetical protein
MSTICVVLFFPLFPTDRKGGFQLRTTGGHRDSRDEVWLPVGGGVGHVFDSSKGDFRRSLLEPRA